MADNVAVTPGSGATIATDEVGSAHYQYVKVAFGADGTATKVSSSDPLPTTIISAALPSGAATSAKQDTLIGHVDGIEGLLTTIDTDTGVLAGAVSGSEMQVDVITVPTDPFGANADAAATAGSTGSMQAKLRLMTSQLDSIKTAVEILDNTVSGSELQVDVLTMPTVTVQATNLDIRDIDKAADDILVYANTAKDGSGTSYVPLVDTDGHLQVDVLSGGGAGTQYTEDAAAAANPVGNAVILVRADTPAGVTTTDGDNVAQRGTDYGAAYVTLLDSAGAEVSVGGGTQYDEDTASSDAQKLTMAGVTRADTAASQVGTDGDRSTLIVDASGRLHVNVGASALPTGAATDAKLDTIIGHVDGAEGFLTTIASAVKAEDAAHTSTAAGMFLLGVRNDSAGTFTSDNLDYSPIATDAAGRVGIADLGGSITVDANNLDIRDIDKASDDILIYANTAKDGSGTSYVPLVDTDGHLQVDVLSGGLAGTEYATNAAYADADMGTLALVVRDDALTTLTEADGDYSALRVDSTGRLWVNVANTVTVGSHAVTNAGTFAVQVDGAALTALQLIDDVVYAEDVASQDGDKGIQVLAIRDDTLNVRSGTEGDYEPLHTNADGALWVKHSGNIDVNSHAVTNAGTFAVQDAAAEASLSVMDDWDNGASDGASVSGDVAHDTADAGEPVKIGMKAVALKTNPTEVAAGDRTNWYADVSGVPFVLGGHPNILTQSLQVTDADGAQTDTAIITAGANVAVVVTKVSVMADEANTGGVSVRIGFGTANTPAADAAQMLLFHPGIAPGSGVVEGNGAGILGIGASNEDVRVTCEDPAGGSINIIVTYFTTDI